MLKFCSFHSLKSRRLKRPGITVSAGFIKFKIHIAKKDTDLHSGSPVQTLVFQTWEFGAHNKECYKWDGLKSFRDQEFLKGWMGLVGSILSELTRDHHLQQTCDVSSPVIKIAVRWSAGEPGRERWYRRNEINQNQAMSKLLMPFLFACVITRGEDQKPLPWSKPAWVSATCRHKHH